MNNTSRDKMIGAGWACFNARKAQPGEYDVPLSRLHPERKQSLWAAIKTKDPDKAQAMKEAMNIMTSLPGSQLVMDQNEIEEYLK